MAAAAPDPSGADRSLLGLELPLDVQPRPAGRPLAAAGFAAGPVILRRDPGAPAATALADVEGFVADGDPRLHALQCVSCARRCVAGRLRRPHRSTLA